MATLASVYSVSVLPVFAFRVDRLVALAPRMIRYPVMVSSWRSFQVRVTLLCSTWDAVRPVGAAGGWFFTLWVAVAVHGPLDS